jgi:hypothetical protein
MNSFRAKMERELANLRSRRVEIRNQIRFLEKSIIGDPLNTMRLRHAYEQQLSVVTREYHELAYKAGREDLIDRKPIKLLKARPNAVSEGMSEVQYRQHCANMAARQRRA